MTASITVLVPRVALASLKFFLQLLQAACFLSAHLKLFMNPELVDIHQELT